MTIMSSLIWQKIHNTSFIFVDHSWALLDLSPVTLTRSLEQKLIPHSKLDLEPRSEIRPKSLPFALTL